MNHHANSICCATGDFKFVVTQKWRIFAPWWTSLFYRHKGEVESMHTYSSLVEPRLSEPEISGCSDYLASICVFYLMPTVHMEQSSKSM